MMDYTPSRTALGANSNAVERAIEFHEAGGIVTFCWHWNSPTAYLKDGTEENGSLRWWGGFYTRNTDFDISKVMDGSDPEGKALIDADIKGIANSFFVCRKQEYLCSGDRFTKHREAGSGGVQKAQKPIKHFTVTCMISSQMYMVAII